MTPDDFVSYPDSTDIPLDDRAKTRHRVERLISDESERHEILMMLGLEPADFVWITLPGQRGDAKRQKLTLDGKPYPSEDNNGESESSIVAAT